MPVGVPNYDASTQRSVEPSVLVEWNEKLLRDTGSFDRHGAFSTIITHI
ncbi:hypothetical protein T4C_10703 [Trichinella pseudospiralis]|uniref:Uncharacterized protein n=1 Tax=Trichinella pseudospiralis TaxID=6337 RepID=A0A0V1GAL9_TRIPS|nr:hypothetical protein T4C_10703 [Trichinella pseudospiralis]